MVKTMFKNIKPNGIYFFYLLATLLLFIPRLNLTLNEDWGGWISIFSLMSNNKIYLDIYDNKDPLFLFSGFIFFYLFGIKGPFLSDLVYFYGISITLHKFCQIFKFNLNLSLIFTTFSLAILSSCFYDGLRSQLLSIFFIFISIYFAKNKQPAFSGFFTSCIFFSKLPFFIFGLPVFLSLIDDNFKFKNIKIYFISLFLGFLFNLFLIFTFSDLSSYFQMILDNFIYVSDYLKTVGRPIGLSGHISVINDVIGLKLIALTYVISLLFIWFICEKSILVFRRLLPLMLIPLLVIVYLIYTAMWPHHFFILSLFTIFIFFTLFVLRDRLALNKSFFYLKVFIAFLISIHLLYISKFKIMKPQLNISKTFFKYKYSAPPILIPLSKLVEKGNNVEKLTYSRLGLNDDYGLAAFMGDKWEFRCGRYFQFGIESEIVKKNFLACLASEPNYLIISESFVAEQVKDLREKADSVIKENFLCYHPGDGYTNAKICKRK
jgi:hypothetical protein